MDSAAKISDHSLVIALFRAGLMAVLHDYAAAEDECCRALAIEKADDPSSHDIPVGSTKGDEYDDRICFVKKQIHGLLQTLVLFARRDWSLITSEKQRMILSVRLDVLCEYYSKINRSLSKSLTDAHHFVSSNKSWILRKCPHSGCSNITFDSTVMLWTHLCNSHFGSLGEKLLEVSDPNLCEDVMGEGEHCCSLDVIDVCKDSSQHDLFCFMNVEGAFGSFLLSPFTAKEVADAAELQREKRKEGNDIIKAVKKKLRNLPSDRSSNELSYSDNLIAGEDKRSEVLVENANPSDLELIDVEDNGVKPSATLETKGTSNYQNSVQDVPKILVPKISDPSLYKPPPDPRIVNQQATRYGYSALYRPAIGQSVVTPVNRLVEIVDAANKFDPYEVEHSHQSYRREQAKIPKDQELCVICFFERYSTIAMASGKIIHHCQTIHQNAGTKCNLCNARFLKDSDLEFHRRYYHQQQ
ncbi:hypothetical protein OsI_36574 [Oryza sativa Indica Group]|uniref:C2H2-type domain-containing protein n=1 Tax=Oryza sativa subsp. indica TaxID=39946 RepID=B8BL72_ORYSI|nr:hypothetical protein OsI_36574 [Oryza sativa Indica Group]